MIKIKNTEETIILLSFQHRDTLKTILKEGKYVCDRISKYHNTTPKSYAYLSKYLSNMINEEVKNPIFAWAKLLEKPLAVDIETIDRALQATGVPLCNYYLYVLEVPKSKVFVHDFYNFVDMRCDEEMEELNEDLSIYNVPNIEELQLQQAVISDIRLEYIKGVYIIEELCDRVEGKNTLRRSFTTYNIYKEILNNKIINPSFKDKLKAVEYKLSKPITTENYKECYHDFLNFIQNHNNAIYIGSNYFRYDEDLSLHDFIFDMRNQNNFNKMSHDEFIAWVNKL